MPSEEKGFLVAVDVYLLGGQVARGIDAFRAQNVKEAENLALNTFIQGTGAVVYDNLVVVLDAMVAVKVVEVQEIDLTNPLYEHWVESIELFERMMDEEQKIDGSGTVDADAGYGEFDFGG
jgi:hypothetical protein